MREIKFRAVFYDFDGVFSHFQFWGLDYPQKGINTWVGSSNNSVHKQSEQFTGLQDKNGKDVYEGDKYKYKRERGVIEFKNGGFMCVSPDCKEDFYLKSMLFDVEIIGNIHQNSDLLK